MSRRVVLIGLGDLGLRLASRLVDAPEVDELVLAGRREPEGSAVAGLLAACGTARVRFVRLDASRAGTVERMLRRERPALVVQCASVLSPWCLQGRGDVPARALAAAGFALQLPAHLAILVPVAEAVASIGLTGPLVNCSYPDLAHPILATRGLAPAVGIGNAGMIRARVVSTLRALGRLEEPGTQPVRVLAHHAHVTPVVLSQEPTDPEDRPRIYLGEEGSRADSLAFAGPPLVSDRRLNSLPAASGLPLIRALLDPEATLRTSAPGPRGLPGGYPVRVAAGRVELDLPPGVDAGEAVAFQWRSARRDGVEKVEPDGTVVFTEEACEAVARHDPRLAEPLAPTALTARLDRLLDFLGLA